MSRPGGVLVEILRRTSCVLLDFDGPVCAVFAGHPAGSVADELRAIVAAHRGTVPDAIADLDDPLQLLRLVADLGDAGLTTAVADACRDAEVAAVATAAPTPGTPEFLAAVHASGRQVAIVSNNSVEAVRAYLHTHDLSRHVDQVSARHDGMDLRLLKPDRYLVDLALSALDADPPSAVLVGDSVRDIEAGRAAGTAIIGYANKPGKRQRLVDAGADAVVDNMTELADAVRLAVAAS